MTTTLDPMTIATRFFNTPLLIEPAKAAIIAQTLGPRFLGLSNGGQVQVAGVDFEAASADGIEARREVRAGSLVADGLYRVVKARQGYSIIQGVAVIPVVGSLVRRGSWVGQSSGMTSYEGISAQIRAAKEDPEVRAIALEVDSFGGEAHGCFAVAQEIRAARQVKPVEAFLSEFALSAGYMIASQADRITVPEFGDAGSIGVVMLHADFSNKLEQDGIAVTLIHSGTHKVDGNQFEPLPDAVREEWQDEGDAMRVRFAGEVGQGRGARLVESAAIATEARTFRGIEAVRAGLADAVGEAREAFEDYVQRMNPLPTRSSAQAAVADRVTQAVGQSVPALAGAGAIDVVIPSVSIRAASPTTGAHPHIQREDVMSDDVKTPAAETRSDKKPTDAKAPDAKGPAAGANTADDAPAPQTSDAAQAADAAWIMERCEKAGLGLSDAQKMTREGLTREQVLERIIDTKADKAQDGGDIRSAGRVIVTGDARDRASQGMLLALLHKTPIGGGERNEYTSMSLREMARASLAVQGITVTGGTMEFAGAVFAPAMASGGMHSTSDFANILVNVVDKAMLKGFNETQEVFERFTTVGTMVDFKDTKRVGLNEFPSLRKVAEGAEFKYGSFGDHGETAVLATYGELVSLTRQLIINDDLDALAKLPIAMGRAARRTVGDLVFAVLTGNPLMSDGVAVFDAAHSNLAAVAGGPSEATINAGITAMSKQKDRGKAAHALNIAPAFLVAPPEHRSATLQSLNSEYAPDDTSKAGTAKQPRAYNTVRDAAEPLFDARIEDQSWFLIADPTQHDTIEVGYLDGNPAPFLEQQNGWTVDGTDFKVRIDACATALAYQTLYKNAGQ